MSGNPNPHWKGLKVHAKVESAGRGNQAVLRSDEGKITLTGEVARYFKVEDIGHFADVTFDVPHSGGDNPAVEDEG